MKRAVISGVCTTVALAFCLAATSAQAAPRAAAGNKEDDSRPLIEKSILIAPGNVGDFALEGSSYDPANKQSGAGFRYSLEDHPEIRFDVYVYPAGRMSEADAVARGMVEFKAGFEDAEQSGIYHDVSITDERDFQLRPPAAATAVERPPATPMQEDDAEKSRLIGALVDGIRHAGRRVQLRMAYPPLDTPLYSDGYLFYKQLYFFKVRASASRDRIAARAFHALADTAARTLVPAIQVANIGGCAKAVVEIGSSASADDLARALITQSIAAEDENCYPDEASADTASKSDHAGTVEIVFDPGDWNES